MLREVLDRLQRRLGIGAALMLVDDVARSHRLCIGEIMADRSMSLNEQWIEHSGHEEDRTRESSQLISTCRSLPAPEWSPLKNADWF